MRSLKNFDYFRKTEHTRNTRIGGIISLLSLFSIIALIYTQYLTFLTPQISKDMYVSNNEAEPTVEFHMEIVLPRCPCPLLDLQIATGYDTKMREDLPTIKFWEIDGKNAE